MRLDREVLYREVIVEEEDICSECAMIAVQYLILQDRMPSAEAQHILDAFWGRAR